MARGAQNQAKDTFGQAKGLAATSQGNANQIFSSLFPEYEKEIVNPTGYGASGLAAMNTAAQQSTGGSTAGAVGAGNLMAARTRNKGGFQAAGDESAREGMRRNSQLAVENTAENEKLKQLQKQHGMAGEQGLYGDNMREILGALGAENSATGNLTEAGKSGWLQNVEQIISTITGGKGFRA